MLTPTTHTHTHLHFLLLKLLYQIDTFNLAYLIRLLTQRNKLSFFPLHCAHCREEYLAKSIVVP